MSTGGDKVGARGDKVGADYYSYLNRNACLFLTEPINTLGGFTYRPLDMVIGNSGEPPEELQILCTNQSHILFDEKAHNKIYFDKDDKGPLLRLHPTHILSLLKGQEFVMTRYGSDKIWIYRDDTL